MNFLRAFLAVWLVLQVVLPLLPLWGVFLPHEHFSRGRVSARDWQVHGENHRNPRGQSADSLGAKIFSVPMNDGLLSVLADSTAITNDVGVNCIASQELVGRVLAQVFWGYMLPFPPPVPPPTVRA